MKKPDGIVFIDANQYIQLYGLSKKRNKVLDLLRVLQDYIFVTSQLVDEVQRNKVEAVVGYFKDSLERLPNWSGIPHHLLHLSGKEVGELNKKLSNYGKARDDVKSEILQAVARTLERISRSEDDISTSLQPIFSSRLRKNAV